MSLKRPHDKTPSEVNETTVRSPKRVKQKTEAPNVSERALEHPTLASSIPGRSATASTFISSNQILIDDPLHARVEPVVNFRDLPTINKHADALISSFDTPTPIQAATWPYLFNRRSCIGIAETGSGKTLAFGVPCIDFVQAKNKKHKRSRISALVISPTRELALQVHEELQKLTGEGGPRVVCAYGGVPKDTQREALRKAHIVVATPGRLNDFIQEGSAKLDAVQYLVLDEADRMLDQGFADEIRKIVSATAQSRRQTLMFTATWPSGVRELAATYMENAVKITIGGDGTGDLRANQRIKQTVEVVRPEDKQTRLVELLRHATKGAHNVSDRLLVFCLYKKEAARIETFICAKGFAAAGIHGDMSQSQRTTNLDNFKSGKVPILVATDVAARGLDIPSVKLVINFTFPLTVEDYVHRIGRTGRAGKFGSSVTLFTEHDKALSGSLINILKSANQSVPEELLKFGATVKKKSHSIYGDFFKDISSETQQATKILFD